MKNALGHFSLDLLAAICANATVIAEHSGATSSSAEGFVIDSGDNAGNGAPVINDLGLGINAWKINGNGAVRPRHST